jgi:AhpD family alkylhydroperoxidase
MSLRLDYKKASPKVAAALVSVTAALTQAGFDRKLMDLVYLRVSQLNGCGYCVDLHARDLRAAGETNERLDGVAGWHESPYFSAKEKAALAWAEALTFLPQTHAPDDVYAEVRAQFPEDDELANLTMAIASMNALNRIGVGFRLAPKPR